MEKPNNKKKSNQNHSYLQERLKEILMRRYAVEKVVGIKKLARSILFVLLAFIFFQIAWVIVASHSVTQFHKIVLEVVVISLIAVFWKNTWNSVGKFIPKFVLIGLLGWFLIAANIIPSLMINSSNMSQDLSEIEKPCGQKKKEIEEKHIHSVGLPMTRFFSANEKDNKPMSEQTLANAIKNYLEIFIVPGPYISCDSTPCTVAKMDNSKRFASGEIFKIARYSLILMALILFIDMFFSVSIYKHTNNQTKWLYRVFSENSWKKESDIRKKLGIFCFLLVILSVLSLNYFLLFWVLVFLTTIFIFKWEINQRGQNHKALSRAILFVFLTQIFSALSGMILFLTMIPIYTFMQNGEMVFNIYDSIVLGWAIILGASITVLLGIITQVIWSGKRMTEHIKSEI